MFLADEDISAERKLIAGPDCVRKTGATRNMVNEVPYIGGTSKNLTGLLSGKGCVSFGVITPSRIIVKAPPHFSHFCFAGLSRDQP